MWPTEQNLSSLYRQAFGLLRLIHLTLQILIHKVLARNRYSAFWFFAWYMNMETKREEEIEDMSSLSPPTMGSMQIAGSNGFGHSIDFMSEAYLRNRYSGIDIEEDCLAMNKDRPLPIFLKVINAQSLLSHLVYLFMVVL
jgi:hypothetical protein